MLLAELQIESFLSDHRPGDIVFFYHEWEGIVAAGVVSGPARSDGNNEQYRDVRFLTRMPSRETGVQRKMTARKVSEVTGKGFFWARTIKLPYLDREETQHLLGELGRILSPTVEAPARTGERGGAVTI